MGVALGMALGSALGITLRMALGSVQGVALRSALGGCTRVTQGVHWEYTEGCTGGALEAQCIFVSCAFMFARGSMRRQDQGMYDAVSCDLLWHGIGQCYSTTNSPK